MEFETRLDDVEEIDEKLSAVCMINRVAYQALMQLNDIRWGTEVKLIAGAAIERIDMIVKQTVTEH